MLFTDCCFGLLKDCARVEERLEQKRAQLHETELSLSALLKKKEVRNETHTSTHTHRFIFMSLLGTIHSWAEP